MSGRCSVCGAESDHAFRVVSHDGATRSFDRFECAIEALAPRCGECGRPILGNTLQRGGAVFCDESCARRAANRAVDQASEASFPASDPPAPPPSAIAAVAQGRTRRREGRVGWLVLCLLGVPIPLLLLLLCS